MSSIAVDSIGSVIANLRKARGDTQQQMAEHIGISTQAVSKWETGASLPDIALLPAIADYLEVSIDRLFDRDVDRCVRGDGRLGLTDQRSHELSISAVMRQCWDIHLGFGKDMSLSVEDANKVADGPLTSRVVTDGAFSNIRNGLGYVFLPDPDKGWKSIFNEPERLAPLFRMFSEPDVLRLLGRIIRQDSGFTPEAVSTDIATSVEQCEELFGLLKGYRILTSEKMRTKEGDVEIFKTNKHILPILLIIVAFSDELLTTREAFNYYIWNRSKRFE